MGITDEFQALLGLYRMDQAEAESARIEAKERADQKSQGRCAWNIEGPYRCREIKDVIAAISFPPKYLLLSPAQRAFGRADATLPAPITEIFPFPAFYRVPLWSHGVFHQHVIIVAGHEDREDFSLETILRQLADDGPGGPCPHANFLISDKMLLHISKDL